MPRVDACLIAICFVCQGRIILHDKLDFCAETLENLRYIGMSLLRCKRPFSREPHARLHTRTDLSEALECFCKQMQEVWTSRGTKQTAPVPAQLLWLFRFPLLLPSPALPSYPPPCTCVFVLVPSVCLYHKRTHSHAFHPLSLCLSLSLSVCLSRMLNHALIGCQGAGVPRDASGVSRVQDSPHNAALHSRLPWSPSARCPNPQPWTKGPRPESQSYPPGHARCCLCSC